MESRRRPHRVAEQGTATMSWWRTLRLRRRERFAYNKMRRSYPHQGTIKTWSQRIAANHDNTRVFHRTWSLPVRESWAVNEHFRFLRWVNGGCVTRREIRERNAAMTQLGVLNTWSPPRHRKSKTT